MTNHHISDLIAKINNAVAARPLRVAEGAPRALAASPSRGSSQDAMRAGRTQAVKIVKTRDTMAILNVLQQEGLLNFHIAEGRYAGDAERQRHCYVAVCTNLQEGGRPLFSKIDVISKPGRRIYVRAAASWAATRPRAVGLAMRSAPPRSGGGATRVRPTAGAERTRSGGASRAIAAAQTGQTTIIRTSQGIMTTRDANMLGLGGELILSVRV